MLRKTHKEAFAEKHGVGLGFMGFFVKACVSALQKQPGVNAYIDGDEIEYHDYVDISVAVGTPKGLVVPVVRNAHLMSFAQIEADDQEPRHPRAVRVSSPLDEHDGRHLHDLQRRHLRFDDVDADLEPPAVRHPRHAQDPRPRAMVGPERPRVRSWLRPMMYLALSYDHRVVDGEQAVRFLVQVKECIENPERLLLDM